MNAAILFESISQAIIYSLGQALIIYILTRMALQTFKGLNSSWRYNFLYSAMILIFGVFVITFANFYLSSSTAPNENLTFETSSASASSFSSWNLSTVSNAYWISIVYLGGICFQAILLFVGYYRLKIKRLRNLIIPSQFWIERVEQLQRNLKVSQKVSLHFSENLLVPFTAGFIKPVILFPAALLNHLSIEQVESILLHELAHIKRNDYLMNLLQRAMEIILFFNPFVWMLAKQIKVEREFCCDEEVLRCKQDPANYARALTMIEEYRIDANSLAMAISSTRKNSLLTRIQKITDMKTKSHQPKARVIAVLSVLAISLSLAWIIPADRSEMRGSTSNTFNSDTIVPPPMPAPPPAPPAEGSIKTVKLPVPPMPPAPADPELPVAPAPPAPIDTNELKKFFNSKEWKQQMEQMKAETEKMKKMFDSPEWKKQMQDMKIDAEKMKKQFDSPEWKKQMEQIKIESEKMKKQFDSPEWKKQMQDMKLETEKMKKQLDSPEWKKKAVEKELKEEN